MNYPHLATSLSIRGHNLKNRLIMGPHQAQLGFSDGLPEQRLHDYLLARARGGAGMLIVEGGAILPNSLRSPTALQTYAPGFAARWARIVASVQAEGVPIVAQMFHSGRQGTNYTDLGGSLWAPSPIPCPHVKQIPKEMELQDIDGLVEAYRECAGVLREAGFDGVEVQACHGYILNEFLSPYTNKRTDEYGGSRENRWRLLLRVLETVRKVVGDDLIVGVRLASQEHVPGGVDLDESIPLAKELERTGHADYLSVSQGVRQSAEYIRAPMFMTPAYACDTTAQVKQAVGLPVFTVGRMTHPDLAETALKDGKADAVVFTREFIADADFGNKTLAGRPEDIRRCVGSLDCVYSVGAGRPLTCLYNPEIGREGLQLVRPARSPKKVLVVGAGPAGLEAARVASLRGHEVTVVERGSALGGALRLAAETEGRAEFMHVIDYYRTQLERLGVSVSLNHEASVESITAKAADVVIVATGASPLMPPSPCLPELVLEEGAELLSYLDALSREWRNGEHAVLVDGEYNAIAMTVADHLTQKGVRVSIVTQTEKPALLLDGTTQKVWFQRVLSRGGELLPFRSLTSVTSEGAHLECTFSGKQEIVACDAVIYAQRRKANDGLYRKLEAAGCEVMRVGDCVAPRSVIFAVHSAFEVATKL